MRSLFSAACLLGLLLGCSAPDPGDAGDTVPLASPEDGGAVSTAPVPIADEAQPATPAGQVPEPEDPDIDWSPIELAPGTASLSCELDYAGHGDGEQRRVDVRVLADRQHLHARAMDRLGAFRVFQPDHFSAGVGC